MTTATIEITTPTGSKFQKERILINTHTALNGVSVTVFLPTMPVAVNNHPHAEIKAQYAYDVEACASIPTLEAHELWQVECSDGTWEEVSKDFNLWGIYLKFRRHPHADSIIEWHKGSDENKARWQYRGQACDWNDCDKCNRENPPSWDTSLEYRLRPRTCKVTLQNGTVLEYPEPVRKPLNHGVIHLTQQAAEQHLSVLQAINAQVAE